MELKQFLADKNYAHLLGELETNFTITPKGWSIMDEVKKVNGYLIAGNGTSHQNENEAFLFIFVIDGQGRILVECKGGWCGSSRKSAFRSFVQQLKEKLGKVGEPFDFDQMWKYVQELADGKRN